MKDYVNYLIGFGGLVLSLFAFVFERDQTLRIILLMVGIAVLIIFVVFLYISKINQLQEDLNILKKEYGYTEQLVTLKREILQLQNEQRRKTN